MARAILAAVLGAAAVFVAGANATSRAAFVVSSTGDGGLGSLRVAITGANLAPGADSITFAIGAVGSQQVIAPASPLPAITDAVTIDGWSQGGAGYTGPPLVTVSGTAAGAGADGLVFDTGSAGSTLQGLAVNAFTGNGVVVKSASVRVSGNYIGTNAAGTAASANGGAGISVAAGTGSNVIGTNGDGAGDAVEGNVVSGNLRGGIELLAGTANEIAGNLVGTNAAGDAAVPNHGPGVVVSTSSNLVGSDGDGTSDSLERNVVSGNLSSPEPENCSAGQRGDGIQVAAGASANHISGNYVGLNKAGTAALGNDCDGIHILGDSNIVGTNGTGSATAQRNVSAANQIANIHILSSTGNVVAGNYAGPDASGTIALFNPAPIATMGVYLDGVTSTRVGTNGDGTNDLAERNVISGNLRWGVLVFGSDDSVIAGNWIGLGATGAPLFNGDQGVWIRANSERILVGTDGSGNVAGERNVIAANWRAGVEITTGSVDNVVAGNWIGTDSSGAATSGYANSEGVHITAYNPNGTVGGYPLRNVIGTNGDGIGDALEGNVIAGNGFFSGYSGVTLLGANDNVVAGNRIGVDATGAPAGNTSWGVWLGAASGNRIEDNTIKNNGADGIRLTTGNSDFSFAPAANTAIAGNEVSMNAGSGVASFGPELGGPTLGNTITGNTINGNSGHGVLNMGASPTVGSNTIQGNAGSGVHNVVQFAYDDSPATASDDVLSQPLIGGRAGGNTISGNCTSSATDCAGIFSLDTGPSNAATLEADNAPAANSGAPFAEQRWYGTLELVQAGTPIAGGAALASTNGGPSYALNFSSACPPTVLDGTIIHGTTSAVSCTSVYTWPQIKQYVVDAAGVRTNYTPQSANGKQYSFDANAATHPTNTGGGFNAEGIQTGSLNRYQVMEAPPVATAVTLRSFSARRASAGVTLTWRTASEAGLLGFNVLRRIAGQPRFVRLTGMIAARGTPPGARYRFVDRSLGRRAATYRLAVVDVGGRQGVVGFAQVTKRSG